MKRLIFLLILLLAIPMAIFAQDIPTEPPSGWQDILMNPGIWFASFTGVTLLSAFLAAFFNGLFKIIKNFPKQLCAWVIAIILVIGSDLINFGYAKDFPILFALINGFFAGLASNGWFDVPILKMILDKIGNWFPQKK